MEEVKRTTIYLSLADHTELKVLAARARTTITGLIKEAVKMYIKENQI